MIISLIRLIILGIFYLLKLIQWMLQPLQRYAHWVLSTLCWVQLVRCSLHQPVQFLLSMFPTVAVNLSNAGIKPGGCDKNMIIEQAWFSFHQVFPLDLSAVGSLRKALGTHSHTAVERLTEIVHRFLWSIERITWYRATGCKIASLTPPAKAEFYNELLNSLTLPYTDLRYCSLTIQVCM